jgi:probable HAF family extracellular repeat protein
MGSQMFIGKVIIGAARLFGMAAAAGAVIAASPITASAVAWYSVTPLDLYYNLSSTAVAINNNGQVAGEGGSYGAALYSNGAVIDLGSLNDYSVPRGINNLGQVVGRSGTTSYIHAALFSNGTVTDLGAFPGLDMSEAYGINNSGQAVGYSFPYVEGANGFLMHATLFSNSALIDLDPLGLRTSMAYSINDSGQAVGYASWTTSANTSVQHAVLFSNGAVTDLGSLGGNSVANSINDSGQAVGTSYIAGNPRASLFAGGAVTDLGALVPGGLSFANSINNVGKAVGWASLSGGAVHAALFSNGTVIDLNDQVSPALGMTIINANGINDAGQIVCGGLASGGGIYRTLLLTPINPPSAPTNVTATAGNGQATVTFTPPTDHGGSPITSYTVTANPGNITANGSSSPITVTGLTNYSTYTFSLTATNSDGSGPAATATNLDWLGVAINGAGSGSVNSVPNGISCTGGACGNNFSPVLPGNQVSLTPIASNGSQFTGWGGSCTGSGACTLVRDPLYQSVTATFDILPNAQVVGSQKVYGLLQSAYDDSTTAAVIRAKAVTFSENLALAKPKAAVIEGGFDSNFSTQSGRTIIQGGLGISQGSLRVGRLAIR